MTVAHLSRAPAASEAVTVINAADYGRAIYDLATRRALITVGEDMVNIAYDAPVDMAPRSRSRTPSGGCSNWPRPAAMMAASRASTTRSRRPSTWPTPPSCATAACRASPPAFATSTPDGRPAAIRPDRARGPPGMGKTSLATNIAFQYRPRLRAGASRRTVRSRRPMAASSASFRSKCRRNSSPPASFPSRPKFRHQKSAAARSPKRFREAGRLLADDAEAAALHRPDRRHLDRPAGGARPPPEAPARPRRAVIDYIQLMQGLQRAPRKTASRKSPRSPPGSRRWQGAWRPHHRAVAAVAPGGKPRRQAPAIVGPARIGLHRAGRRRGAVRLSARNIT
jgi:hypothetical protein